MKRKTTCIVPADEIASVLDLLALPMPEFVSASYYHLLGRNPDPTEMRGQCGSLRAGLGRVRFLGDLATSTEYRKRHDGGRQDQSDSAFLEETYLRYLGRQIDPQGMDGYLRALGRGKSRRSIIQQIARSREARSRRTLWFELEQLLADEKAQRHWLRRWIGKSRRSERSRNREIEVAQLRKFTTVIPVPDSADKTGPSLLDLEAVHFAALGANAQRVLARVRQAADRKA